MKQVGKFKLLDLIEFQEWLRNFEKKRTINRIQQHHTFIPAYKHFDGNNHFKLCESMERSHIERGFDEIGQNITTFPDGTIMLCRDLNIQPAGIKLQNSGAICIENVGDFDLGKDSLNDIHRHTIIQITKLLLQKFAIVPNKKNLVYHHWFDLKTGERIEEEGKGAKKSCPGTNFFGGNTVEAYNTNFLPLFT